MAPPWSLHLIVLSSASRRSPRVPRCSSRLAPARLGLRGTGQGDDFPHLPRFNTQRPLPAWRRAPARLSSAWKRKGSESATWSGALVSPARACAQVSLLPHGAAAVEVPGHGRKVLQASDLTRVGARRTMADASGEKLVAGQVVRTKAARARACDAFLEGFHV